MRWLYLEEAAASAEEPVFQSRRSFACVVPPGALWMNPLLPFASPRTGAPGKPRVTDYNKCDRSLLRND